MLRHSNFKPMYATGEDEPVEFFLEGLLSSSRLDMGLGYFSSSAINTLSLGFAHFLKHGGSVRILINDSLSAIDKEAVLAGLNDRAQSVEKKIIADIIQLKEILSKRDKHFFKCLSWLIASQRLEIKALVPKKNKIGIVHQKFGIFSDWANEKVIFTGSSNFSKSALVYNIEDIWCDFSWNNDNSSLARINYFENIFFKAWTGTSDAVQTIPIEDVKTTIRNEFPVAELQELINDELNLIEEELSTKPSSESFAGRLLELSEDLHKHASDGTLDFTNMPELRDYQAQAITNWTNNYYKGILEMATGTGKTITAIAGIFTLLKEKKRLFVIISCPFIHLAEQWQDEVRKFGLDALLIGESKDIWEDEAAAQSRLFNRGKIPLTIFITTNSSFKADNFQKIISANLEDTLIIIDEVHYAGAFTIRQKLPKNCPFRLGLSATPERHGDFDGTQALMDYFDKVVFSFPIEQAIGKYLTNYYYYPIPVELSNEEFEEYCSLSLQMVRLQNKKDEISLDRYEKLAIKRARVQNNSHNKLLWIRENIADKPLAYSLFYAGDQIFNNIKQLLGKEMKISIHEFTSRQSRSERKRLLQDFNTQKIQSLIAMKCLDEGVDVPPTRVAYFFASSSNPREFIQRRGRVLRLFPGKEYAIIYDLISIPPKSFIDEGRSGKNYFAAKSAFTKEYLRVQEFASMALNQFDSLNEFFLMANQLDILDLTND